MAMLSAQARFSTLSQPAASVTNQYPQNIKVSELWLRRMGNQTQLTPLLFPSIVWSRLLVRLNSAVHPTLFSFIQSGAINNFTQLIEHLKKEAQDLRITNTEKYQSFQRYLSSESILALDQLIEETNFNIANRDNYLWKLIKKTKLPRSRNYQTWNAAVKSFDVRGIDKLEIKEAQLTRIPHGIFNLTYLETLSLSSNMLSYIPSEISQLQKLITLNLSNNQFRSVPKELCALQNLRYLILSHNLLIYLPIEMGDLENLNELNLDNNNLYFLPREIMFLFNLEKLHLANNNLNRLPRVIGLLENLRELDLSNNQLPSLPETFENFFPKLIEPYKQAFQDLIDSEKMKKIFKIAESIRFYSMQV